MTSTGTRLTRLVALSLLLVAACTPNATGGPSNPPPSTGSTGSSGPSGSPSAAAACPVVETSGPLPSDRVTGIKIESTATADLVTFTLGERSSAPTNPAGKLSAIQPPFTDGGSGLPVDVRGTHFVEIRLEGILLSNDDGTGAYQGEYRYEPHLPALQGLVNVDAFEGHFTWIAGYDGFGCVTLAPSPAPNTFVVSFGH
jgi:hypothetical protein